MNKLASTGMSAVLIVLGVSMRAEANFNSLARRLPASSNSIIAVNVAKVLQTPYAKNEWAPNTADAWAKEPIMIPPGSTRLLMASEVNSESMEPIWEMSLMEFSKLPSVETIAKAEGGHVDRVWDKDAVASPINAYFIPLDGTTLASITPANRSAIAKWVRTATTQQSIGVTSDYLKKVLVTLGEQTDILMAMDLQGAWGVPQIRRWLSENDIGQLKDAELDDIARVLGTMNGIALTIDVDQGVKGRAVVDFDGETASLAQVAKPIMVGVLNTAGMRIDDINDWNFSANGKTVTMEGKLSTGALRRLMSIVQSPIPAATVAQAPPNNEAAASNDPVAASQRYYKAICAMLDNFKGGTSASNTAGWARATSKRIDQMPILNVDPQLVQWGSLVSTKLKGAGATMGMAQTQINSRVAGIADPSYSGAYDNSGLYHAYIPAGEQENVARQRRQAALEVKAQAQEQALRIMDEIAQTRPAIRQAMVEKYKVEF